MRSLNQVRGFVQIWSACQTLLPRVVRWGRFLKEITVHPRPRKQNTLQHSHSLVLAASVLAERLLPYSPEVDCHLFLSAVATHDHGEGYRLRDTQLPDKCPEDDADEFVKYMAGISAVDDRTRNFLTRAFLLQHALHGSEHHAAFPEFAQSILWELSQTSEMEALWFGAVENYDYVLYALEQHDRGVPLFDAVIRKHIDTLNGYAEKIPGFREEIWTLELSQEFSDLVFLKAA